MFERLKRLLAPPAEPLAPTLAQCLLDYPPYDLPHLGCGRELSLAQARENLAYFEAVRPERLRLVAELLRAQTGIDIAAALEAPAERGLAFADAMHEWAGRTWLGLHRPEFVHVDYWLASRRAGEDIALSLAFDVAVVFGELIRLANTDWRWDLDLEPSNLKDEMVSSRRVVLLADPVGEMRYAFVNDVEDVVTARMRHPGNISYRMPPRNPWRELVDEGQRGADMAFWRTTVKPPPKA